MVFCALDLLETLVLVFQKAAAEAFKFFAELLNAPVDLPIIAPIFKSITGTDLTYINVVCYASAIPFTILYKLITGEKPFQNSSTLLHSSAAIGEVADLDHRTISRGILTMINVLPDISLDISGFKSDRLGPNAPRGNRILNAFGIFIPCINAELSKGNLQKSPMYVVSWSITTAAPVLGVLWLSATGFYKGPRGNFIGQVLLCLIGSGGIGTAIWHAFNAEDSSLKTVSLIFSQVLAPLSNAAKIMRAVSQHWKNPVWVSNVTVALPVIDVVSGVGAGTALIISGSLK
ncbi:hypothetical protein BD410DRAFT_613119 [Rickenella mellea]|uniref:Uncharacterized protein n=1 Tax=Rickenella mellea TaxID=50990 RepID=A0A4Y7PQF6_9AGAM|nr:hypothetical protein BD410DRAFT_613119 [Rickenella mellea]